MKTFASVASILFLVSPAASFSSSSSFSGSAVTQVASNNAVVTMEYIPSGMSKAQWEKMKQQEKNKNKGKNLGAVGISTFKSRTFAEWQKAGGKNLFPVDPKKVKDPKEIPYMQRPGGSADDSDIGAKKSGGLFAFGKKKEAAPAPEPEKKQNWWTL
mmetsp:Transcript_44437/g.68021  ORF Transcript_44437/g.68021 Transcript_44437/m.68021 type:complete len:157 (-) Transcript_44437:65-535(-)|eukprot:CAMPEP_0117023710 /NCGR_PEP_ID=MMETSP0472-20121206/17672_1 /TAXON_ID=693140 ORGANISM="Tiarina fusus, Strain LIS" /NCGR_SAMPLE_ID=MMETSP0472 /ASSEMBLY_ACC=CAM_ASM_000603 /LENGTH=156 /DNA_ID=CAMNT_0004729915 /DNA_START=69 /DNA_END=539 /DNA_ORIENTATION=+